MAMCGCTQLNLKRIVLSTVLLICGLVFGILLNRFGYIMENIEVEIHIREGEKFFNNSAVPLHLRQLHLHKDKSGVLPRDSIEISKHYRVPNIVHFIWFGEKKEMKFLNYVSITSAYKIQRPDVIMFHCDNLPMGEWWDRIWREVPLKIVYR